MASLRPRARNPGGGDERVLAANFQRATSRPSAGAVSTAQRLTEAQLSAIWRGQRLPLGALVTRAGVPVTVIFQGRAGRGPGPDFRNAVIAGPSRVPMRGDVELHVRASDWRLHGHGGDRAYAGVILHVVFDDDDGSDTPLPGGGSAPVVALAPWVARRAGDLERWLTWPQLWREPCHAAVRRLGEAGVTAALEAEGDRRLAVRVARFERAIAEDGIEQAVYEGLLEALGFGGNAAPMLALARGLPWARLSAAVGPADVDGVDERRMFFDAALLGAGGLLPSQREHGGGVEPYAAQLEELFARARIDRVPELAWKLWGMRPSNMPARRIAGAAALLATLAAPSALLSSLRARTAEELVAPLTRPRANAFWREHHDLCAGSSRQPAAFIGRPRALEIATNVLVPAALAAGAIGLEGEGEALAEAARTWWGRLPRPASYGATRFVEEVLRADGLRLPLNARRGQGLLALQRDWCSQNGCGRCPLS